MSHRTHTTLVSGLEIFACLLSRDSQVLSTACLDFYSQILVSVSYQTLGFGI